MFDKNKFVVRSQILSSKTYEILDADNGEILAVATEKVGVMAMLLGLALGKDNMSMTIEVRRKPNEQPTFSVRRSGLIFKKVQVLDVEGQVIGTYKSKMFSLSGGFHVYDREGKHIAEIKGQMFKSDYKFVTPDGAKEIGSVSRTWGGLAKSLLTGAGTYGVQIEPAFAEDRKMKTIILGAAIAVDAMFKPKASGAGSKKAGGEEGKDKEKEE